MFAMDPMISTNDAKWRCSQYPLFCSP